MAGDLAKIQGLKALKSAFTNLPKELGGEQKYAVGTPLNYGKFLEDGTSRMPAYPWLQPAVDETVRNGGNLAAQAATVDGLLRLVAVDIEKNARARLQDSGVRPYPDTGALAGGVTTTQMK